MLSDVEIDSDNDADSDNDVDSDKDVDSEKDTDADSDMDPLCESESELNCRTTSSSTAGESTNVFKLSMFNVKLKLSLKLSTNVCKKFGALSDKLSFATSVKLLAAAVTSSPTVCVNVFM